MTNKENRFYALLMLAAVSVSLLIISVPAFAKAWKGFSLSQADAVNGTNAASSSTLGPLLKAFNATSDLNMDFMVPMPSTSCEAGSIKNLRAIMTRLTAITPSAHPQAGNRTYEIESQKFFLEIWVFNQSGAVRKYTLDGTVNATGASEDRSVGEAFPVDFHGQITGLQPGDTILARLSRNATNSADNSTATDVPLGLTGEFQECGT